MPLRTCIERLPNGRLCGKLSREGRCETHREAVKARENERTKRRNKTELPRRIRASKQWKTLRQLVLNRDGNRCTYGTLLGERYSGMPDGRCPRTISLDAHHIVAISAGGAAFDRRNLRCLCSTHHARVEADARRKEHDG